MKQLPFKNLATGDYVMPVVAGETYTHKDALKLYKFFFSSNQGHGIGPGWNGAPFNRHNTASPAFKRFSELTKALAEVSANVIVYLVDA